MSPNRVTETLKAAERKLHDHRRAWSARLAT